MDYFDNATKTVANSYICSPTETDICHFPSEGLCFGTLSSKGLTAPALLDLQQSNGLGFLYNNEESRKAANTSLELLAWRIALCLNPNSYQFIVYNGGYAGEYFNSLTKLNRALFRGENNVYFDGNDSDFLNQLKLLYKELPERASVLDGARVQSFFRLDSQDIKKNRFLFLFISDIHNILNDEQKKLIIKLLKTPFHLGVYVFYSLDIGRTFSKVQETQDSFLSSLKKNHLVIYNEGRWNFYGFKENDLLNRFSLSFPSNTIESNWCQIIEKRWQANSSVSVDIRDELLNANTLWSKSSLYGLEIPIGLSSANRPMFLELNNAIVHGLIGGGTGSGKSVLLHNIIINGAWLYSPRQLEFIILDCKGTDFGIYSNLPNARVIVSRPEKEYCYNTLLYIAQELDERQKIFHEAGCTNIQGYNNEKRFVPRLLVIIDEFQNLFVKKKGIDNLQEADLSSRILPLFEIILEQGRAFGVHLLLSSHDASVVPSIDTFLQLLNLRIVLPLERKGVYLHYDNDAQPSNLRTGEGIYNDGFGVKGKNQTFQTAFYGIIEDGHEKENYTHLDAIKKLIPVICHKAETSKAIGYPITKCICLSGESFIENNPDIIKTVNEKHCTIFVGSPVLISPKDVSFEIKLNRGNNILITGYSSYLKSLITHTITQFAQQSPKGSRFDVICSENNKIDIPIIPGVSCKSNITKEYILGLKNRIDDRRKGSEDISKRFVCTLMNIRDYDSLFKDLETKKTMEEILKEGAQVGVHVIMHVSQMADFSNCFKQEYSMDMDFLPVEEVLREFRVKIEMTGVKPSEIFANGNSIHTPEVPYLANIQTEEGGPVQKFIIYK